MFIVSIFNAIRSFIYLYSSCCFIGIVTNASVQWSDHEKHWKKKTTSVTDMPVTFQSDTIIIATNLAASGLNEIWR